MEAKVLRAALSAAIRVTVSSSLLGCGGATTFDPQGPGPGSSEEPPQSNGGGGVEMVARGGGGGLGNAGGTPGAAGTPIASGSFCDGSAMRACEPIYDELAASPNSWSEQLDAVALGCCKVLVDAVEVSPPEIDVQCRAELGSRLNLLRDSCCPAVEFQGNACAPWGPPVPPELDLERLLSGGAAA
jgi:hypothetical protein